MLSYASYASYVQYKTYDVIKDRYFNGTCMYALMNVQYKCYPKYFWLFTNKYKCMITYCATGKTQEFDLVFMPFKKSNEETS